MLLSTHDARFGALLARKMRPLGTAAEPDSSSSQVGIGEGPGCCALDTAVFRRVMAGCPLRIVGGVVV